MAATASTNPPRPADVPDGVPHRSDRGEPGQCEPEDGHDHRRGNNRADRPVVATSRRRACLRSRRNASAAGSSGIQKVSARNRTTDATAGGAATPSTMSPAASAGSMTPSPPGSGPLAASADAAR